jgi:hypothetical protein
MIHSNRRKMKRVYLFIIIFSFTGTLFADDYMFDLVNALSRADLQTVENILKTNINTMSPPEKRVIMNFAIIYSRGESTLKIFDLLQKHDIRPTGLDLYTAINRNQPDDVIQYLLKNGVEPNGEILLLTMEKQKFDLAKQFIEAKVDVNYQYPLTKSYSDGMTPLLYASKYNNLEMVKLLLENGAKLNATAKDGSTALSIAQRNDNASIFNYLTEYEASGKGNNIAPQNSNVGILSIMDNQQYDFLAGTYRLYDRNTDLKFTGTKSAGSISFTTNGRTNNGIYRVEGSNITLIVDGRSFLYKMDSNLSFSGNGEVWVRIGN